MKPSEVEITCFEDLLDVGLAQATPQRLLLLLIRAEPEDPAASEIEEHKVTGAGTLTPVMATDLELTHEVRLDVLVEEADQMGQSWDFIMVSCLSGEGSTLPDSAAAEPYLQAMAEAVQTGGDLSPYAVFDRAGSPVQLQRQQGQEGA